MPMTDDSRTDDRPPRPGETRRAQVGHPQRRGHRVHRLGPAGRLPACGGRPGGQRVVGHRALGHGLLGAGGIPGPAAHQRRTHPDRQGLPLLRRPPGRSRLPRPGRPPAGPPVLRPRPRRDRADAGADLGAAGRPHRLHGHGGGPFARVGGHPLGPAGGPGPPGGPPGRGPGRRGGPEAVHRVRRRRGRGPPGRRRRPPGLPCAGSAADPGGRHRRRAPATPSPTPWSRPALPGCGRWERRRGPSSSSSVARRGWPRPSTRWTRCDRC